MQQNTKKTMVIVAFALGVVAALWFGRNRWGAVKDTLDDAVETVREDPRVHDAMQSAGDFASTTLRDKEEKIRSAGDHAMGAVKDTASSVRTQAENLRD